MSMLYKLTFYIVGLPFILLGSVAAIVWFSMVAGFNRAERWYVRDLG